MLYPIQLRLSLAEQYRDAGDQEQFTKEIAQGRAAISQLNIEGETKPEFLRLRASLEAARKQASAAGDQVTSYRAALSGADARLAAAEAAVDNARLYRAARRRLAEQACPLGVVPEWLIHGE